jgi:hypothetical protein
MNRALPIAALALAMTCAGLTALAPAAHAEDQCRAAGVAADFLSVQQQKAESILVGVGMPIRPMEKTHGGRLPHCGEPCTAEEAERIGSCMEYSWNGSLVRTPATCRNGVWTPEH